MSFVESLPSSQKFKTYIKENNYLGPWKVSFGPYYVEGPLSKVWLHWWKS